MLSNLTAHKKIILLTLVIITMSFGALYTWKKISLTKSSVKQNLTVENKHQPIKKSTAATDDKKNPTPNPTNQLLREELDSFITKLASKDKPKTSKTTSQILSNNGKKIAFIETTINLGHSKTDAPTPPDDEKTNRPFHETVMYIANLDQSQKKKLLTLRSYTNKAVEICILDDCQKCEFCYNQGNGKHYPVEKLGLHKWSTSDTHLFFYAMPASGLGGFYFWEGLRSPIISIALDTTILKNITDAALDVLNDDKDAYKKCQGISDNGEYLAYETYMPKQQIYTLTIFNTKTKAYQETNSTQYAPVNIHFSPDLQNIAFNEIVRDPRDNTPYKNISTSNINLTNKRSFYAYKNYILLGWLDNKNIVLKKQDDNNIVVISANTGKLIINKIFSTDIINTLPTRLR